MLIRQMYAGEMPQLVMFDLDGTLVDSVPDIATATDQMLEALGKPPAGIGKTRLWIGNGVAVLVQRALRDADFDDWANDTSSDGFQKAKALFDEAYDESCGQFSTVYDGVYGFLNALNRSGVTMAVITNKSERFTGNLLEQRGLADYFSMVICGDSLPEKKPNPAPLLHVLSRFDVPAEQALMVGDSRHDIAAAKAAGVKCVAVPYGYNHGEPVEGFAPDTVVENLKELIAVDI
ncbi:phosphoglycolate phosphatase [Parendozoicomonas sp. Alg238-R29]|uniref:phosphoglycolate phosphatase n=1 Tax=Parendozoicomonas sp. Alg238-R29 TaxID=2993446 RepID=UPI00248D8375|nr:phosphoglycolate phosphatase [Parendozoicomonas sp. Alg238-R29]